MAQLLGMLEYGAINIAEIAARAGTSVGSIYQFYPNRDAILYALAEAYLADLREASAGVVNDTSLTQRQRAEQAVNWLLTYVDAHPGVLRMLGCNGYPPTSNGLPLNCTRA
ncbi:MAG: TetR/AcrR family transcriptional regulator [Chloroflexi bacterium]|nr:TetR/AcrR family transcriptional regulator [Chloroflexota bacterium]